MFPKDVTVLSSVNSTQQQGDNSTAHAQPLSRGSKTLSEQISDTAEYVFKKDFNNLSQQVDERCARFEALLPRGNIFATPKVPVNVVNPPVSEQQFIDPNAST